MTLTGNATPWKCRLAFPGRVWVDSFLGCRRCLSVEQFLEIGSSLKLGNLLGLDV